MEFDNYLFNYKKFNFDNFPNESLEDMEDKILEEMRELRIEINTSGTLEDRIAETIDVFNMSVKLLTAYGVKDICHEAAEKLRITSEKYQKQLEQSALL